MHTYTHTHIHAYIHTYMQNAAGVTDAETYFGQHLVNPITGRLQVNIVKRRNTDMVLRNKERNKVIMCVYVCVYVYMFYIYIYTHTHMCLYIYIVCVCIYIYIYIYI
jgi:hypothetical protein